MAATENNEPDFLSYQNSLGEELNAVKNRVRHLIQDKHWLTDGAFKEAVLRSVLRRHLPETFMIGTGFVVATKGISSQIDILIVDRNFPTLFKDGDLLIVTPQAVRGIIEVKTTLSGPQAIEETCSKLSKNAFLSRPGWGNLPWTGIFVYDSKDNQEENFLSALYKANRETQCRKPIDAIAYGDNVMILFGANNQVAPDVYQENTWVCWNAPNLPAAYFIGLLLNNLCGFEKMASPAWLPSQAANRRRYSLQANGDGEIQKLE